MKKIFILFAVTALFQSCIFYVINPEPNRFEPCLRGWCYDRFTNQYYFNGRPMPIMWWYDDEIYYGGAHGGRFYICPNAETPEVGVSASGELKATEITEEEHNSVMQKSTSTQNYNGTNGRTEYPTSSDEFQSDHAWDSCRVNGILTFNVYLGHDVWSGYKFARVYIDKHTNKIDFNIYSNYRSVSLYGFHYKEDRYYKFSTEGEYCGNQSFSIDVKYCCKYEIIVNENNTNEDRYCSGHWTCNHNGGYDGEFRVEIYQFH